MSLTTGVLTTVISAIILMFYSLRSRDKLPRTWKELLSEFYYQYYGISGILEDKLLSFRNNVDLFNQDGKVAVITGGNRGIGIHVVEKLLDCKITVVLGVRNVESSRKALEAKIPASKREGKLFFETLDVGSMKSVRKFAEIIKPKYPQIDLLINNAGNMSVPFKLTEDGFESQVAVNYLGHFLLTHLLLSNIKAAGTVEKNSRIVNVTSCLHYSGKIHLNQFESKHGYPIQIYMNAKLALVLFTVYLQKLLNMKNENVLVFAVHPGTVNTHLFDNTNLKNLGFFKKLFLKHPEEGSRSIAYAAISPDSESTGGIYISNCVSSKPHKLSQNNEECKKLFEYTCNLLNISNYFK